MDCLSYQLLARTRLPGNKNITGGGSNAGKEFQDLFDFRAVAHDAMVVDASGSIPYFHFLGSLCFGGFQCIPDDGLDFPHFKGFGQIVIGTPFHGLDGCRSAGVSRDHNYDCIRM